MIKELGEKIEKQFTCLGQNAEKYVTFTVPLQWRKSYKRYILHITIH